jgi:hypothetical protein
MRRRPSAARLPSALRALRRRPPPLSMQREPSPAASGRVATDCCSRATSERLTWLSPDARLGRPTRAPAARGRSLALKPEQSRCQRRPETLVACRQRPRDRRAPAIPNPPPKRDRNRRERAGRPRSPRRASRNPISRRAGRSRLARRRRSVRAAQRRARSRRDRWDRRSAEEDPPQPEHVVDAMHLEVHSRGEQEDRPVGVEGELVKAAVSARERDAVGRRRVDQAGVSAELAHGAVIELRAASW